jgi:NAD-dependent deacetylase
MDGATTGFVLDDALDAEIARAAALLRDAQSCVALTGAGLSVESGIPPFRGPGGLWTKYGEPPMDGFQRFLRDPAESWRERLNPSEAWARGLRETLGAARPNAGHLALAELERRGLLDCVITQNIDDLHRQAGSAALLEIHGNHRWLRCIECQRRFDPADLAVDPERLPPLCPGCEGWVKGDTVQFGEPIPPDVLRRCYEAVERADCMLLVGTSGTVYPAADFPLEVLRRGGALVEVNPHPSELSELATLSLRGPAGAVLERLVHHAGAASEPGRAA